MPSPKPFNIHLPALPPKPYPLIELFGDLDVGKSQVAEALARKLKGNVVRFPSFNATRSITGIGLLLALGQKPRALEQNPNWWAHMYLANLWENMAEIEEYQSYGPVILVNWVNGFKTYYKAATCADRNDCYGLVRELPSPDFRYLVRGDEQEWPGNLPVNFSPPFRRKLQAAFNDHRSCTRIWLNSKDPMTFRINNAADQIAKSILSKRPDLKSTSFHFPKGHF